MKLLNDACLIRTESDYSKEKITPPKAVSIFSMACRVKYFHVVPEVACDVKLEKAVADVEKVKSI